MDVTLLSVLRLALIGVHVAIWGTLLANLLYLQRRQDRTIPERYPSLSVLIPARNEADNLRRLLPALARQDHPRLEVIVYDDGSEDATWDVLHTLGDERVRPVRGSGPPAGWVGKVHALYQATRRASGEQYLFLDADANLPDRGALRRVSERFMALPDDSVLTGLTRLRGAGGLLVSLVPNAILTGLPWPLVRPLRVNALGALNGQCWMIGADDYHAHEPHEAHPDEVLEDVQIGRYLKARGYTPELVDVQREVSIHMYAGFADAWRGFRKNAYLILGGSPAAFVPLFVFFALVFVAAPLVEPWLLASLVGLKATTDRWCHFPWPLSALAWVSYLLGSVLQLDSAISHWTGRVSWKGRSVGASGRACDSNSADVQRAGRSDAGSRAAGSSEAGSSATGPPDSRPPESGSPRMNPPAG
jgi:hypothetical protein